MQIIQIVNAVYSSWTAAGYLTMDFGRRAIAQCRLRALDIESPKFNSRKGRGKKFLSVNCTNIDRPISSISLR